MSKSIVKVNHLNKVFESKSNTIGGKTQRVHAVNDVTLDIKRGETLALVGESGCGKSTTGKLILNLLKPTSGQIYFSDQLLFDSEKNYQMPKRELQPLRKHIQMIFQDPFACLDPRMTVFDIVSEGIKKHMTLTKHERVEKVKDLLKRCGLDEDNLLKFPHQFSGGQRQRIGIARALSLDPEFIVCDEPTAALDVSIQSQILNLMMSLKHEMSLTYLFISHNLSVVEHFCDRVCVMYLGEIVEQSPTEALFSSPKHPYTKALMASAPKFGKGVDILDTARVLSGEVPSPSKLPSGCKFHTRCPQATEKCKTEQPKLIAISDTRLVRCHLIEGGEYDNY